MAVSNPFNGNLHPGQIGPIKFIGPPLNWFGSPASSNASDPSNWSPNFVPQSGELLRMHPTDLYSANMDVTNNALAGAKLALTVDHSIYSADISMDASSIVSLTAQDMGGFISTIGGTLNFIGTSTFDAGGQFFTDTNLTGTGTLNLQSDLKIPSPNETMEFGGTVGSGLTINVVGAGGPPLVTLRIDHPDGFQGLINLPQESGGLDSIIFEGLQATSGDLMNGILQLFNGTTLLSTTRIHGDAGLSLELVTTQVGTSLTATWSNPGGTMIPLIIR